MDDNIGYDKPEYEKTQYGGTTTTGVIRESLFDEDIGVQEILKKQGRKMFTMMTEQEKVLKKMSILVIKYNELFKKESIDQNRIIKIKEIVQNIQNIQFKNVEALLFAIKFYYIIEENLISPFISKNDKISSIKNECQELFEIALKEVKFKIDFELYEDNE